MNSFTSFTENTQALLAGVAPQAVAVRRTAFYLQSQGQPLFAWLHRNPDRVANDHGVIICSPLGHEQLHAHRGLRHLADSLASSNIPVLRFDWHGTGDSAGSDGDERRYETWQANLRDAVRWMRKRLGCRHVSLVGLRIGAALAAASIGEEEIENLVLWSPIHNGRAYVREMTAIDLTSESRPKPADAAVGDIEAGGFLLSQAAAADLSKLNLLNTEVKCRRVLIVSRNDMPQEQRLVDRFTALEIPVEQISLPGVAEMLAEPHRGEVPHLAIREISHCLGSRILPAEGETAKTLGGHEASRLEAGEFDLANELQPLGPSEALLRHRPETGVADQFGGSIRERAIRISSHPDLFGILSEPESGAEKLPTILLLNAGASYRIGPGRLHVHMAREFAVRGFRTLRLDLCGLGDSVAENPADENDSYTATAFRDIQLTLQYLRRYHAVDRCLLMGLCSGAYAAFQSAAQFSDPMLLESVLINPLTFFWKKGMSLDAAPLRQFVKQNYYMNAALKPEKWLKLLTGRSRIGLLTAGRLLVQRLIQSKWRRKPVSDSGPVQPSDELGHPLQDNLPDDLARIDSAGRTLAMFFSKTDPGYQILTLGAGPQVKLLRKSQKLRIAFIENSDHTFSRRVSRRALIESISSDLLRKYGGNSRPERR